MQLQQGDVTFERISQLPAGARTVPPTTRGYVLAEGEATGHAHVIDPATVLEMREKDGVLYARISESTQALHEEHRPVNLAPGLWRIGRVQEYDHFAEEARNVAD